MIIRFTRTITLPSGNLARNFRFNDRGYGRVTATYEYTDRRRNHQVARRFTVELLNGKVETIQARSARGGRVETFKTSTILSVLIEMLAEVNRANEALSNFRKDVAEMRSAETTETPVKVETNEQDGTDLMNTVRLVGMGVVINMIITLVTLGIVWYNL